MSRRPVSKKADDKSQKSKTRKMKVSFELNDSTNLDEASDETSDSQLDETPQTKQKSPKISLSKLKEWNDKKDAQLKLIAEASLAFQQVMTEAQKEIERINKKLEEHREIIKNALK